MSQNLMVVGGKNLNLLKNGSIVGYWLLIIRVMFFCFWFLENNTQSFLELILLCQRVFYIGSHKTYDGQILTSKIIQGIVSIFFFHYQSYSLRETRCRCINWRNRIIKFSHPSCLEVPELDILYCSKSR